MATNSSEDDNKYIGLFTFVLFGLGYWLFFSGDDEVRKLTLQEQQAQIEQENARKAEKKRQGFHCLSEWDGTHAQVRNAVKQSARNPDSFQHVETKIMPVNKKGKHTLFMTYRATNGFGAVTTGRVTAIVDNASCKASIAVTE